MKQNSYYRWTSILQIPFNRQPTPHKKAELNTQWENLPMSMTGPRKHCTTVHLLCNTGPGTHKRPVDRVYSKYPSSYGKLFYVKTLANLLNIPCSFLRESDHRSFCNCNLTLWWQKNAAKSLCNLLYNITSSNKLKYTISQWGRHSIKIWQFPFTKQLFSLLMTWLSQRR